jgi:hypothetical protein
MDAAADEASPAEMNPASRMALVRNLPMEKL